MTGKAKAVKEGTPAIGPTFEESLKRLEEIVEKIEGGKVNLDEVMKMYEEGVRLSAACLDQLAQAETRLKRLAKDAGGKLALVDDGDDE
jgi:exodeoxyribonuclease VII small subunit